MNKEWYECRVRYEKTLDTGERKKVTETYVVKAVSVSDAETRVIEELTPLIEGEFAVNSVKEASFRELFLGEGEKFYLCKLVFVSFDERSGKEKKSVNPVLLQADDFDDASRRLAKAMQGTVSDYEIFSVAETPVLDIFG